MAVNRIAIIPARGGSKRIPRKNIKNFCGKPMIAWSIEAALASGCFESVVVSTDDPEIAEVALKWGATVPFMRPASLADDYTGTGAVMRHSVEWLSRHEAPVDFACCLYATAPFVSVEDLQKGWHLVRGGSCNYAFPVTRYAFPIQRALRIEEDGKLNMFSPKYLNSRSQDLEEAWHDAGQFYWGAAVAWLEERSIFGSESIPIKLPRYRVQDIDTPEDWVRAEWMFRAMKSAMGPP